MRKFLGIPLPKEFPPKQASEMVRMNFLHSNPYLLMDSIRKYEAATVRIHLNDNDPYEELLHNVNEVETLLQDPVVLAAVHKLLDPDADLDDMHISASQSEAISPEECALPRFSRRSFETIAHLGSMAQERAQTIGPDESSGYVRSSDKIA